MYKILVVARREYAAMVATKAFLFTLIMMPVLMLGGVVLMPLLSKMGGGKTRQIVVIDQTGKLLTQLQDLTNARTAALQQALQASAAESDDEDEGFGEQVDFWELSGPTTDATGDALRLQLSEQIREGKLYAFVEIPADLFDKPTGDSIAIEQAAEQGQEAGELKEAAKLRFVSQDAVLSSARQWFDAVIMEIVREHRLSEMGIEPSLVAQASIPVAFEPTAPYTAGTDGELVAEKSSNVLVTLFLPFGIMMLMFMVIFLAAQPMLESGMEEKGQRIAELLLGTVSPTQLMAGKLLGNVCGSLVIFVIYGIGGWSILSANDMSQYVPLSLVPWFLVFQLLAVLFFSSIFLTVGASISELKEAQSLLLPVWLVLMAPLMVWFAAIRDPNGTLATTMSLFPPSAPLMMTLRLATGQAIPVWQPPLAALLLMLATMMVIYVAGRIYRASLLRTDSATTVKQIFGRLKSAT
jgi:ABC-2 type transport system permease protein